jgi:hypothetical protein
VHCSAQAYGGGSLGWRRAQALRGDGAPWKCPVCDPPPALQKIQQDLNPSSSSDEEADDNKRAVTKDAPERTVEDVLQQLYDVECEKRTLQDWDDPDAMKAREEEFRQEFREKKPLLSEAKLNLLVAEELALWKELCDKHDKRLDDMSAPLQEELETVFNIDMAKFFEKNFGEPRQRAGARSEEDEDEDDDYEQAADWKRAADRAIAKREKADEKEAKGLRNHLPVQEYEKDIPEQIEDLGTHPDDEKGWNGEGFRNQVEKADRNKVDEIMAVEDDFLVKERIPIQKRYNDKEDVKENCDEERRTSRMASGGASRVRRDNYVVVRSIRRKNTASAKKSKKNAPATAAAAAAIGEAPTQNVDMMQPGDESAETPKTEGEVAPHKGLPPADSEVVDLTDDSPKKNNKKKKKKKDKDKMALSAMHEAETEVNDDNDKNDHDEKDFSEEYYCPTDPEYVNSKLILSSPDTFHSTSGERVKTIKVSTKLEAHLKPHQIEAVKHLWKNAFEDLNVRVSNKQTLDEYKNVGGSMIAHNSKCTMMLCGLGQGYTLLFTRKLLNRFFFFYNSGTREKFFAYLVSADAYFAHL